MGGSGGEGSGGWGEGRGSDLVTAQDRTKKRMNIAVSQRILLS